MIDLVGHQLGNYRVLRLLGRGDFADVYLGEQIHLKSDAALKVVRTQMTSEQRAAFLQEARILAHLKHPYIVRVLDFAVEAGIAYLVLEYAPGGSLRTTFPGGTRMPLDIMLQIVRHVVSALQYAHDEGFVHRDVKPENLLWGSRREVLLSNFGLTVFTSHTQLYNGQDLASSGASTSPYLAPEQLQGQSLPASDQYALGTMIYEWLTGIPPLQRLSTSLQQLSLPPSIWYTQPPDIPPAVEEVVLRALAREPGQRFASVRDLGIAMERAIQGTHLVMPAPASLSSTAQKALDSVNSRRSENPQTAAAVLHGNAPVFLTPLLGREQDMERVCALLPRSEVRVLTLVGPGGVGKTRLGLAVAQRLHDSFRDGVCFVSLAPIRDHQLVMSMIAQQLEVTEKGEQSILDLLIAALRDQQLLLLLDNMEQVVAAAPMLAELLAACPGLKLLITSRALLHLQGEHLFLVQPLALPDLAHLPDYKVLAQQAAVAMFLQRAQAMQSDFSLTADNACTIAEICVRLDGLPLAIELAAARIRLLPPQLLLDRLAHRLSVLTRGASTLPERQKTLRKTLQWSYDLLNVYEQRLFRYLSVFVNGFTLEAAEEICGARLQDDKEAGESILDGVDSLLEKSLLRLIERPAGESRLVMLETVREYGLECLTASGELEIVRQKHATYYQALAREAGTDISSPERGKWLSLLEREKDNLRAALNWSLEQAEVKQAQFMSNDLFWFWWTRDYPRERRMFLERGLTAYGSVRHDVRGWALQMLGILVSNQGDFVHAVELWQASLVLFREAGGILGIAWALSNIGIATMYQGEYTRARQILEESLVLFRGLEEQQGSHGPLQIGSLPVSGGVAFTLFRLASISNIQGDYVRARTLAEGSLSLLRATGDSIRISLVLEILALATLNQGDYARAHTILAEKLVLDRENGIKRIIGTTLSLQGHLALLQGEIDKAYALLTESIAILNEIASHWMPSQDNLAEALSVLGRVIARQGDLVHSQALHEESLEVARRMATPRILAFCLEGLAEVVVGDNPAWAVQLWGAAETFRETRGTPLPAAWQQDYKRAVRVARTSLDAQVFSALWTTGRNLSLDLVLVEREPVPLLPSSSSGAVESSSASSDAEPPPAATASGLTSREMDVLHLLAQGLTSVQIAEKLVVSTRTINAHLRSIYSKLGVSSRGTAVRYALDNHLI